MSVPTSSPAPWPDCESLHAQVLDGLEEGVALLDCQLRVRSWNQTLAYFSGLAPDGALGQIFFQLVKPLPALSRAVEQAFTGKPSRVAQVCVEFCAAGAGGWFTISTRPLRDRAGQVIGCLLLFREVPVAHTDTFTLREKSPPPPSASAASTRPVAPEALQAMLDSTLDVLILLDSQGQVVAINQAALARIQRTKEEVIGRSIGDFLPPEVARLRFAYGEKVLATGQTHIFEDQRAGRWLEHQLCPVVGPDGKPAMVAAFTRDITDRKNAEFERDRLMNELRQSESRLRAILEGTSESVFLLDADRNVLVVNHTGAQRLNLRPEQCLGRPFDQLLPEPSSTNVRQLFAMVQEQKVLISVEGYFGGLHYESTFYPVLDERGEIKHIVAFARDITARKHAEDSLLNSQLRLQTILDNASVVFWAVDREGVFTLSEGNVLQQLGLRPKEAVGRSAFEMYRDNPAICADIRRALAGERFEGYHETGGRIFDSRLAPLRGPDREIVGAIGVSLDITARVQAEQALSKSQALYRQIVETAEEGIWLVDRDWLTTFANRRMEQILGYEPGEMLGRHPDEFTDETGRRIAAENYKRREQGQREIHDFKCLRKDGSEIWVSMSTNPIKDETGAFQGALAMVTDITERRQADLALRESEERYRTLFDAVPVGIGLSTPEGRMVSINQALQEISGFTLEEFQSVPMEQLYALPEQRAVLLARLRADGRVREFELILKRKHGFLTALLNVDFIDLQGKKALLTTFRDITERKQTEEALRASEAKYRRLYDSMQDAYVSVDLAGRIQEANHAYQQMLGYSLAELRQLTYVDVTPEKWHAFEADIVNNQILPNGFSAVYEKEYRHKNGHFFPVELRTFLLCNEANEALGMWAIVRDITQRKEIELALRESEERYRAVFNGAGEGIVLADLASKRICYPNPAYCEMYGYSPDELCQLGVANLHPEESVAHAVAEFEAQARGEKNLAANLPCLRKDGSVFFADVNSRPVVIGGRPMVVGFFVDITVRKQSADALHQSEERFSKAFNLSPILMAISRLEDGLIIDANDCLLRSFGLTREQAVGKTSVELGLYDDVSDRAAFVAALHRGESVQGFEVTLRTPKGRMNCLVSAVVIHLGDQPHLLSLALDITARKQAEVALRENESRLRFLFKNLRDTVSRHTPDSTFTYVSPACRKLTGFDPEDFIGRRAGEFVHPDEVEGVVQTILTAARESRAEYYVCHRLLKKAGDYVWVETLGRLIYDAQGQLTEIQCAVRDISERKLVEHQILHRLKLEHAIATISARFAASGALEAAIAAALADMGRLTGAQRALLFRIHEDSGVMINSHEWCADGIASHQDLLQALPLSRFAWWLEKFQHDEAVQIDDVAAVAPGLHAEREWLLQLGVQSVLALPVRIEGRVAGCVSLVNAAGLREWGGEDVMLLGVFTQILSTAFERDEFESALRKSESFNRQIIASVEEGIVVTDLDLRIRVWNSFMEKVTGISFPEVQGRDVREFAPIIKGIDLLESTQRVLAGQSMASPVYEYAFSTGKSGWAAHHLMPLRNAAGNVIGTIATIVEVSERQTAEEALRKSEQRFRSAFDDAPTGVCLISPDGRLLRVNRAMPQIFGYDAAEMLGMHFRQTTHPEDVGTSAQGYQGLLAGDQQTFEIEKRYFHKSGRIVWALVRVHLLRDAQGEPLYFLAHILDITARKQAEEKLKHSGEQMRALAARIETVREEDRSQIAREVHDDLGQSLTGLKLDLAWLARHLPESAAESRARAAEMSGLIDATINSVRRISSELRPSVLDDLGLVAAVEWQTQEFERRTGVPCRFRSTGEFEELEARRATALFRILQEALTNVIRHALASRVSVKLTRETEAAQIEIRDNGRGITREELSRPGSLGLLGMRERAFAFGGEVLVTGRPGRGTTVTARMPLAGPSRDTELLTAADLLAEASPQPEPARARRAGRKPKRKPPG